jgi:hypothetical protein
MLKLCAQQDPFGSGRTVFVVIHVHSSGVLWSRSISLVSTTPIAIPMTSPATKIIDALLNSQVLWPIVR